MDYGVSAAKKGPDQFTVPCSLLPVPYSLFPIPCSLFPVPYSLFPIPCPCPLPFRPLNPEPRLLPPTILAYLVLPVKQVAQTCFLSLRLLARRRSALSTGTGNASISDVALDVGAHGPSADGRPYHRDGGACARASSADLFFRSAAFGPPAFGPSTGAGKKKLPAARGCVARFCTI